MGNLVLLQDGAPYLHNKPYTFINYLKQFKADTTLYETVIDVSYLENLKNMALQKEIAFFKYYDVTGPEQWANTYLARTTEEASLEQVFLDAWNSLQVRKALKEKGSDSDFILKQIQNNPSLYKDIQQVIFQETGIIPIVNNTVVKVTEDVLQKIVLNMLGFEAQQINKSKQTTTRNIFALQKGKNKRTITSQKSKYVADLEKKISYYNWQDKAQLVKNTFNSVLNKKLASLTKKSKIKQDESYQNRLEYLRQEFFDLLDKEFFKTRNDNVLIGNLDEKGTRLILNIVLRNDQKSVDEVVDTSTKKLNRFAHDGSVSSKTDLLLTINTQQELIAAGQKYRFQLKNSDIEEFEQLELSKSIEETSKLQNSFFFRAQDSLSWGNFKKQAMAVRPELSTTLSLLEYLLVNLNVLNQNYTASFTEGVTGKHGTKLYKIKTNGGEEKKGIYSQLAIDILSSLISQYCQVFFSDLLVDLENKTFQGVETYDFVIFKSRILVPMSVVYEDMIKLIKNTEKEVSQGLNRLDTSTTFKSNKVYSEQDFFSLYVKKYEAVDYNFEARANYQGSNASALIAVGQSAGENILSNQSINIGEFKEKINLLSLTGNWNLKL